MMNEWDIANAKREAEERAEARGRAEGKAEEKTAIATKMLKDGLSVEMIAKYTGLPESQVKTLA